MERLEPRGLGRVRMARKSDIFAFAKANIAPGTTLCTDGDRLYQDLPDVTHTPVVVVSSG